MNQFKSYIPWLISCMCLAWVCFQESCGKQHRCPDQIVKTDTVVDIDTVKGDIQIQKGELAYVLVTDTVPMEVDTGAILKDFFSQRLYANKYDIDSTLSLKITDTVSHNEITGRGISYEYLKRTTVITNTHREKPKNRVFAGVFLRGNSGQFGASANLSLLTKKNALVTAGYDPFNKNIMVGLQKVISFKRE